MADLLTPVGRLVYGNLYTPALKKNNDGTPKLGADGTQVQSFDYGIAIPKGTENHWAETPWGQIIWNEGHAAFPNGETQRPDFAWKVHDGDSQIPNRANKRPCDKEGYPGHWVINFSSSFPSKYVNSDGTRALIDGENIKPGYYIQIAGTVVGNKSTQSPGVYMNHGAMSLQSVFEEIAGAGVDAAAVGFGQAAMPGGIPRTNIPAPAMQMPAPTGAVPVTATPIPAQPSAVPAPVATPGNPTAPVATPPPPPTHAAQPALPATPAPVVSPAAVTPGSAPVQPIPGYGIPVQQG